MRFELHYSTCRFYVISAMPQNQVFVLAYFISFSPNQEITKGIACVQRSILIFIYCIPLSDKLPERFEFEALINISGEPKELNKLNNVQLQFHHVINKITWNRNIWCASELFRIKSSRGSESKNV